MEAEAHWYAVHTRSHQERKVQAELERRTFEVYLPEYRTVSRRRDRRKEIQLPLFAGYLFVRTPLEVEQRIAILQATGVVRLVGVGHRPVPVPDHEVRSVQIMLTRGVDAAPCPLQQGQMVEVLQGPLTGVIGVVERSEKHRIIVSIELVGRAVSATLDTDAVVPYLRGT